MEKAQTRPRSVRAALHTVLVAVLALAASLPVLRAGPVYDDHALVIDNPLAHRPIQWMRILGSGYWHGSGQREGNEYRPVTILSFALLDPLGVTGQRAANAVLHGGASVLVLTVVSRLLPAAGVALPAALLFALHPVHAEVLGTLVGRGELLAANLVLLGWWAHLRRRPVLAAACGAAAFLSKESAIVLPAIVLLGDWVRGELRKGLRSSVIVALGMALAIGLRISVFGGLFGGEEILSLDNPLIALPAWERILSALASFGDAMRLALLPIVLLADRTSNVWIVRSLLDPRWALGVAVIGAPILARRLGARSATLGLGIFLLAYLPVSNLVFPVGASLAERLLYLPALGACVLLGWALSRARRPAFAVVLPLLFAGGLWSGLEPYRDEVRLWEHVLHRAPQNRKACSNLAAALLDRGRPGDAAEILAHGLALYPDHPPFHRALAETRAQMGDLTGAITEARVAASIEPRRPEYALTLAGLLYDSGDDERARALYEEIARNWPAAAEAWWYLGRLRNRTGDHEGALAAWERAELLYGPGSEWGKKASREIATLERNR